MIEEKEYIVQLPSRYISNMNFGSAQYEDRSITLNATGFDIVNDYLQFYDGREVIEVFPPKEWIRLSVTK